MAAPSCDESHEELLFELPEDEEDEAEIQARYDAIRLRERAASRPWRSLPALSPDLAPGAIRSLELGRFGAISYRIRSFPPKGCSIATTGGVVWDASLVLCKFMECREAAQLERREAVVVDAENTSPSPSVAGRRVVELGAGLGLPSIAAYLLGAAEVVATDLEEHIPRISENISLNASAINLTAGVAEASESGRVKRGIDSNMTSCGFGGGSIRAAILTWGDPAAAERLRDGRQYDTILCSDVLFADWALVPLVETICMLAGPQAEVLSCSEHRWSGATRFYSLLEEAGFEVAAVPLASQHPDFCHESIHLYCARRGLTSDIKQEMRPSSLQRGATMSECSVCLGSIDDCCQAPCGHKFCRTCILKVLEMKPPEWCGACPLCRAHVSVYNIRDDSGSFLAQPVVQDLYGCVFVQGGTLGLASYHFNAPDDCYISYTNAPSNWTLDDGNRPPAKKRWLDYSYDPATFTFRGTIEWSPAFKGAHRWTYEIIFSEDFAGVVGGQVDISFLNGTTHRQPFKAPWERGYDRALAYLRWTPPPSTIFGSVYVQGMFYAPMLEGVASYHFDSEDDCYVSYTNAPPSWLLDDGSVPPTKKAFSNPSYDAETRTFRGRVEWDPLFGGAARWEYEMIFAEDFASIIGGELQEYGPNEERTAVVRFLNPNGPLLPFIDGMHYVQKPGVLTDGTRAREAAVRSSA